MTTYRPTLRPGSAVLRRDAQHLQIGTSPGTVVRDRPGLHRLLLAMDGLHDPAWLAAEIPELTTPIRELLAELTAAGVVVDAGRWGPAHAVPESRHLSATGRDPGLVARRALLRVALVHDSGNGDLADLTDAVLRSAGVLPTRDLDPDLVVLICTGEPSRSALEETVRQRVPHLVVRVEEDRAHVGPLVSPGRTPCIGCHDLHRSTWDRAWTALLPQFGRRSAGHNPPALGAVLPHVVVAEIAQVVLLVADRTVAHPAVDVTTIGPGVGDRLTTSAGFHPRCSCALLPPA